MITINTNISCANIKCDEKNKILFITSSLLDIKEKLFEALLYDFKEWSISPEGQPYCPKCGQKYENIINKYNLKQIFDG